MDLLQFVKENPEKTLAEIQEYKTFNDVSKNDIVNHDAIFGVTEIMEHIIAQSPVSSLKKEARIFKSICNGLLESVNVMDATTQHAMTELVASGGYPIEARNYLEGKANINFPFADVMQQQLDEAKATLNIQKQECTYLEGMSYIITTANQGIDIDINTDIDCSFTAYLMVCADTNDQTDISNYSPINGDNPVTTPIKSISGKATIALSNRKVRGFNKLFIKPSKPCTFTAEAKANRG